MPHHGLSFCSGQRLTRFWSSDLYHTLAEAVKTAASIAAKSPVAVRATKIFMLHGRDHSVAEGLQFTQALNAGLLQSEDLPTAMAASMQKKKATFAKL